MSPILASDYDSPLDKSELIPLCNLILGTFESCCSCTRVSFGFPAPVSRPIRQKLSSNLNLRHRHRVHLLRLQLNLQCIEDFFEYISLRNIDNFEFVTLA